MNAISKKLLSMFLVVAMALSMVPFGGLSIFAVETNATEVVPASESDPATTGMNASLDFATSNTQVCPKCGSEKTWQPLTAITANTALAEGHYYVPEDGLTNSAHYLVNTKAVRCIHLNGQTLTSSKRVFQLSGSAELNIFGSGTVKSTTSGAYVGAVYYLAGGCTVNLYGGTHAAPNVNSSNAGYPIRLESSSANLNIYDGATISTGKWRTIHMTKGTVTMHGGTINGGNVYSKNGGAILVEGGTFNMDGGMIQNTNTITGNGGNVYVAGGTFNMTGGTIQGGEAASGGNVGVNGGTFKMSGDAKIYGGNSSSHGGNILVQGGGTFDMSGGEIYGGEAGGQGGNFRVYQGDLIMSGDAKITGGTAGTSPNVWLVDSDLIMSGNAQVLSLKGSTANGGAVNAATSSAGSRVILSGNATVKGDQTVNLRAINLSYNEENPNVILINNDWIGEAYLNATKDGTAGYKHGETMSIVGYCGALDTETMTVTKGNSFTGNLHYNSTNTGIVGSNGDLIAGLASVGDDWFATYDDALNAYYAEDNSFAEGKILTVNSATSLTLSGDIYIESKSYDLTIDGEGKLYALDRSNDDYSGSSTWTINSDDVTVVTDVTNPDNGNRYIVIKDKVGASEYSAHRIEVQLTAVTLRASEAGLYYKASYKCDSTLAGRISSYGVVLSTKDMPGADFLTEPTDGFSCLENFDEVHETDGDNAYTVAATSGSVFGIFKDETLRPGTGEKSTAQLNAEYGEVKIYANTYFLVNTQADEDDGNDYTVMGDEVNDGTQGGIAYSLWDALMAIENKWDTVIGNDSGKQEMLKDFYETWNKYVESTFWDGLDHIKALAN